MLALFKTLVVTLAAAAAPLAQANLANTAAVYLRGEPGSYVSGGIGAAQATWVHGVDGVFSANTNFSQGISVTYNGDTFWHFDFAAPKYDPATNTLGNWPLQAGLYANATRWPFNSPTKPGMDISGAGRGNNQESGWFNVLEVQYGPGSDITAFAVDFRQYDETLTQTGPSLYGSLRFNSAIPLALAPAVPEPAALALMLVGLGGLGWLARRRGRG